MINFIEIARQYAEKNMVMVPAIDKAPRILKNWQNETLENILSNTVAWKKANGINMVLGERSGVIVIDIDIIEADKPELFKKVMALLPPAMIERQGNPKKQPSRFFQYNGERARKFNAIQVEILSDGNNCCMPPGWNHQSQTNFFWVSQSLLDIDIDELPLLSQDVIDSLDQLNEQVKAAQKSSVSPVQVETTLVKGRCRSGSHNKISAYAVARRKAGHSTNELVADCLKYDVKINSDADSLYFNCKSRPWKGGTTRENAQGFIAEVCSKNPVAPQVLEEIEKYPTKKNGFYVQLKDKEGNLIEKWAPDYHGMSRYFKNEFHLKNDDSYRMTYKDGYYQRLSNTGFDNAILKLGMPRITPPAMTNFKKTIAAECFFPKENFKPKPGLINMNNLVLDTRENEAYKHSPEYFFTYKLSHDFDRLAKCPEFDKFIDFIFDSNKNLVDLISEIIGYTLIGGEPFKHRAFMFFGEGRNGKSTLLDIIIELLGRNNVSSVSMKMIDKPFSAVRLDGMLANIVEESPTAIDPESFKNIVGGGSVSASFKNKDEFDLKVNARMFFACNEFPHFKDSTVAIKDRLVIIPFKKYIKDKDRDTGIAERLRKESSGILNFALRGLERFKKNNNTFTATPEVDAALGDYMAETDSVAGWVRDNIEYNEDILLFISLADLYNAYKTTVLNDGLKPVAKNTFSKRMKNCIKESDDRYVTPKIKEKTTRGYTALICTDNALLLKKAEDVKTTTDFFSYR